jgi:mRNA interferase MazF
MMTGITYKQRDIVLLPFPYSDLSSSKRRPALVVSCDEFNFASEDIVCCVVTKNPQKDVRSVEICGKDVSEGELHFDSKVKPYRLFTVSKKIVLRKICRLGRPKFNEAISKLHSIVKKAK